MRQKSRIQVNINQVRAFTLKRQFLINPAQRPLDAVKAMIAIQIQYAGSVPIAIRSRCSNVKRDWFKNAFSNSKKLIQENCFADMTDFRD